MTLKLVIIKNENCKIKALLNECCINILKHCRFVELISYFRLPTHTVTACMTKWLFSAKYRFTLSRCVTLSKFVTVALRKHLTDVGLQKCDMIRVKHNEVWKFEIIKKQYFTNLSPVYFQSGNTKANFGYFL